MAMVSLVDAKLVVSVCTVIEFKYFGGDHEGTLMLLCMCILQLGCVPFEL